MSSRKKLLITVAVALGTFLGALDTTIVGTAMPTVITSLGGLSLYSWAFAAYMLTCTIAAPIFGKLSDLFGAKRLFVVAIGIFLVGSALCGGAQSMVQLIVFRGVQGIGAGGLFALASTIIGIVFTAVERPRLQGLMQVSWATASIVGPLVGGFIVDHVGWQWAFYVNLPIGVIPIALTLYAFPTRSAGHARTPRIDFPGALLLTLGITALLFGLLQGGQAAPWSSPYIISLLVAAIAVLAGFVWLERRVAEPLVPLDLFANRTFFVGTAGAFLTGLALFGATGFIPLFVQGVLKTSATAAGAALTPLSLGWPAGSIIAGQILNRLGYRVISVTGTALMCFGFYLLTLLDAGSSAPEVGRDMFIIGLGMGLLAPTLIVAIQNNVHPSRLGVATSSVQFFQTIGGTVGVSAMGALLAGGLYGQIAAANRAGLLDGVDPSLLANLADPQFLLQADLQSRLPLPVFDFLQRGLTSALQGVFWIGLVALAAGVVVACLMPHSTPSADMSRGAAVADGEG